MSGNCNEALIGFPPVIRGEYYHSAGGFPVLPGSCICGGECWQPTSGPPSLPHHHGTGQQSGTLSLLKRFSWSKESVGDEAVGRVCLFSTALVTWSAGNQPGVDGRGWVFTAPGGGLFQSPTA